MVYHRDEQVALLNEDLMGEHQAIVHYLTHAWTVVRQFGPHIEAIARDEMRHFKWLAQTIVALGGVPDLTPPALLPAFSGLQALDYDIDAEEEAISQYLAHQRTIAQEGVQQLLGRIVVDEKDHRRQFIHLRETWLHTNRPDPAKTVEDSNGQRFQSVVSQEYREILHLLMKSFISGHLREVGLTAEDRAIEAMQHLSWMAEAMADQGGQPCLSLPTRSIDAGAMTAYQELQRWARDNMAPLVPVIERLIAHEQYHRRVVHGPRWTVGANAQGKWDDHGYLESR
ncbi:MAG: rubrerythrin [Sulfobacillus acidophilus]|uniref:Rubrerythrin n=1 Tax=Sulfobacillus acidophilus TaxID=53633 RepID=A0A2T2WI44_9FIRM|nr:MAG: rubrerythrin [Sulfobacillus acidophilus]